MSPKEALLRGVSDSDNRVWRIGIALSLALFFYLFSAPAMANAFPVPKLPDDNLIVNPWFRDAADPSAAGLSGWTRVLTDGFGWGLSHKESNPSPDIVISGRCGNQQVYCGTAARWARQLDEDGDLVTVSTADVYLYQVVPANPQQRGLKFFAHWVSHRVDVAEVSVYGSQAADGPWTLVWVPFSHSQDEMIVPDSRGQEDLWEETGFLHTTIGEGYSFYKVELHARLPEGDNETGFKITGVYFATEFTEEVADSTAVPDPTATLAPAPTGSENATPLPPGSEEATSTSLPPGDGGAGSVESTPPAETDEANVDRESRRLSVTTLTAIAVSPTQIQLSWSETENNSRGFFVERSLNGTGDWVRIAQLGPQETVYSDPELNPGTLHYYRLRISSDLTSNVVSVRTLLLPATPTASASATTVSQLAAEPDEDIDDAADPTAAATPSPASQDSSANRPLLLLLLAVIPIAIALLLYRLVDKAS